MSKGKLILICAIVAVAAVLLYFGPEKYLNLEYVKSRLDDLIAYRKANPVLSALVFSAIYIFVTAASIPGALFLTLCCGAIFGFALGTVIALVSATIGATIAFLVARYLFDDLVKAKMGNKVTRIRESFRKEGALYLFSLRLVPVFPFFCDQPADGIDVNWYKPLIFLHRWWEWPPAPWYLSMPAPSSPSWIRYRDCCPLL